MTDVLENRAGEESVSPAELLVRAAALVPLLRKNAPIGEQLRRLPDESVDAVEAAGLFHMLRLEHRGGYGTDPATVAKIMTLIAGGDASVAWVMQVCCGIARLAEVLPEQALAEVYASARPLMAGSFAKPGGKAIPVEGGFNMVGGGSWGYVSGCHHAHSALLRLQVDEEDGSTSDAFALVPMSELTIEDDWFVMGASGTGSNTVTCGDIFIPDHRLSRDTGKAFGSLRGGTLGFAFTAMMPLGLARYALEIYLELAHSRGITMLGYEKMTDSPLVHTAVATAHLNIKLIEAYQFWLLSTLEPGAEPLTDEMLPGARLGGMLQAGPPGDRGALRDLPDRRDPVDAPAAALPARPARLHPPGSHGPIHQLREVRQVPLRWRGSRHSSGRQEAVTQGRAPLLQLASHGHRGESSVVASRPEARPRAVAGCCSKLDTGRTL